MKPALRLATIGLATLTLVACGDDAEDEPATPDASDEREPTPGDQQLAGTWEPRADADLPVTEVGATTFEGELWTVGGLADNGAVVADVQIYDPETDEWRAGPDLPQPVHHTAVVATDTDLVVLGGFRTLGFDPVDDVLVLDQANDTWTPRPPLPAPRGAGAAAWDGERIVYAGGIGPDPDNQGLSDDVWASTAAETGDWTNVDTLSIARDHLAATSDGQGTVWFMGGRERDMGAVLTTVDILSEGELTTTTDLPTARGGVAAFHSHQHGACLAGGELPEGTLDEVECVDAEGHVSSLPSLGQARHGLAAGTIDGVAYVALGGPEPGLATSTTLEALPLGTG